MCKVINLFGEPGSGKSALAAYIFYNLKVRGYNCELVDEFAKSMVYENNENALIDQTYIFGQQTRKMNRLRNNVDIIITDSPILLCGLYIQDDKIRNEFFNLVNYTFNTWDNYNYLLKRNHPYVHHGRLQNEEEARQIRKELISSLDFYKIPYKELVSTHDDLYGNNPAGDFIIKEVIQDIEQYDECKSINVSRYIRETNAFKSLVNLFNKFRNK